MKKADVKVGRCYRAKVSGKLATIKITGESRYGGWDAINTETNRAVHIKSAQRLRRPVDVEYVVICGDRYLSLVACFASWVCDPKKATRFQFRASAELAIQKHLTVNPEASDKPEITEVAA